jgi:hypothetical protein
VRALACRWTVAAICAAAAVVPTQAAEELRVVVAARRAPGWEQIEIARGLVPALLAATVDRPLHVSEAPRW